MLRDLGRDRRLPQRLVQAAGPEQLLHDVRPLQLLVELIGAIEVGQSLQPAIDLPAEQAVTVDRGVVIALRRPEGPFAVRVDEQRRQRLPGRQELEGRLGDTLASVLENHLRAPRHRSERLGHRRRALFGLLAAVGGPAQGEQDVPLAHPFAEQRPGRVNVRHPEFVAAHGKLAPHRPQGVVPWA